MKIKLALISILATELLLLGGDAFAHHGTGALYEGGTTLTLKGVVTEFAWTNPHVQVYFDVRDDKANVVHWACETLSPGKMARGAGWTKDSIKPGDEVKITLIPAKNGAPVGSLRKVVLPNGKELGVQDNLQDYK
jgi:uncharacterized protein DUF6152